MAANILYNNAEIGDYAWLTPSTTMPDTEVQIPRAQGIRQKDAGGGSMIMTVEAWVVKASNAALAQYYEGLQRSFGSGLADLVADGVTYTNVKLLSISPEGRYQAQVDYFICTFKKSSATQ